MMYNILIIFTVILVILVVTTICMRLITAIHKPTNGKSAKTHFKLSLSKHVYIEQDCETNYSSCKK